MVRSAAGSVFSYRGDVGGQVSSSRHRAISPPVPSAGGPAAASPKPPNAVDLTFALAMVPHHAQVVEMSRVLLVKQGMQHLVTALAERIRTDQDREVADMNSWLTAWDQDRCRWMRSPSPTTPPTMAAPAAC
ncbi:DUF305 domain-containing protein [Yinghuangia aomiensis]